MLGDSLVQKIRVAFAPDVPVMQDGPGTEPEPETGTVGTVFQKPEEEPEPSEPFFRNRNRNRLFLVNSAEAEVNPFQKGTVRTENRNRSNRPMHEP